MPIIEKHDSKLSKPCPLNESPVVEQLAEVVRVNFDDGRTTHAIPA